VCIERWKHISSQRNGTAERPGVLDLVHPTCPICRQDWKIDPLLAKEIKIKENLDALAVQRYLDWVYSGTLTINRTVSRKSDVFNVALLK
jgi:hypothetical protein